MASLVILLALTVAPGSAGGPTLEENVDVTPSWQQIPYDPSYAVYDVNVTDIKYSGNHTINASIYNAHAGSTSDLEFKFEIDGAGYKVVWQNTSGSGWIGHGVNWEWGNTSGTPSDNAWQKLKLYVRAKASAPQNNLYDFEVKDNGVGEYASGTTSGTTIPEFPLGIAIPAAISLGIIFLLFRRNQKK